MNKCCRNAETMKRYFAEQQQRKETIMQPKKKTFKAWARKAGSNDTFVATEIRAIDKQNAVKWFLENGYEVDGPIY